PVTAQDAANNTVTGYTGTVQFTPSDGAAVLPADYTFTGADAGTHTFSATLKTAGSQTITATDAVTRSITGTSAGITVNPATATHLAVTGPSNATAGVAFDVIVTAKDQFDNTATGYTGTVHLTSTDSAATLPADHTFTLGEAGTHAFSVTL